MKILRQLLMKRYRELKERIRMMNSQRSDTENNKLIEEGKKLALMKLLIAIKLNSFRHKYSIYIHIKLK